jgi:hypothetical protein
MTPNKADRGFDRYAPSTLREANDLGHRPEPPDTDDVETSLVAIPDPNPDPNRAVGRGSHGQTVRATVNRRVDILEYECSHGRITAMAYRAGRVLQGVFERAQLGGASTWAEGSRVDTSRAKEMAVVRKLLNARTIQAHLKWTRKVLGSTDAEIVRQVIGENRRYGDVALPGQHVRGRLARAAFEHAQLVQPQLLPERERDRNYIAHRFRDALESLATTREEPPE